MINSIPLENKPIEVLNITSINPFISKCDIKVCYVQDTPNRNNTIITKEMGKKLAASLPGSPIVGHYNEGNKDFEEHNRIFEFVNGKLKLTENTKPYGFCDIHAPVWFQWFNDDGVEHEYLMTQGYLWTGQYPEAQGIVDNGNNQSMKLNPSSMKGSWTKDNNGLPQFFIINEAIIENLCILGRDIEPCFEGAQITSATEFSLDDNFKHELFSLMQQMKKILDKGGTPVFTTYAVEIGDSLWNALYAYAHDAYSINGVFEENNQKFAVLQNREDSKYYRLDFSVDEANGFVPAAELVDVTDTYTPAAEPQFAEEAVAEYVAKLEVEETSTVETEAEEVSEVIEESEPEEVVAEEVEPEEVSVSYNLADIPEYVELQTQYAEAQAQIAQLQEQITSLTTANAELTSFKLGIERTKKEELINKFYMLSDEDKKDCVEHIDSYSLDDIEAKLCVICVRNRVSFDLDNHENPSQPATFNLNSINTTKDQAMPAWIQKVKEVAKNSNI